MAAGKKLLLVGYGKMGRLVEQLAPEYNFEVVARLNTTNNADGAALQRCLDTKPDVAVEFSNPQAAPANLKQLANSHIPAIVGTTGWLEHLAEVTAAVERNRTALVWSPNFSVGVAVFRKLAGMAAELMREQPDYGAWAWEIHHDAKKDAPSGTLLQLIETMRNHGFDRKIDVSASRAGRHPGTHEIGFDSAADTITLRHTARSREGFARGALKSAKWILGRAGVYTFEDVLFGKEQSNVSRHDTEPEA